ncbi:MAG: hypothetical protein J6W81_04205 [Lentisphaeria bacterium]|nr:hypothetical protein [Lentisphaeria bacterium]
MDQNQIKEFIAQKIPEGYSLSKIQDMLKEQNVNITFMELRLIAAEIEESVFTQVEKAEEKPEEKEDKNTPENASPADPAMDDPAMGDPAMDAAAPAGNTVVELSKIARPGAVASGSVKFGSGVTAEWILDQMGRLGLENSTGKPTEQDIQEFQVELQKLFSR